MASRFSPKSKAIIDEISKVTGQSKNEIIDTALEVYRHRLRMGLLNESHRSLQSDFESWNKEKKERKILEGTLEDGLEEE